VVAKDHECNKKSLHMCCICNYRKVNSSSTLYSIKGEKKEVKKCRGIYGEMELNAGGFFVSVRWNAL
jgi:hypothetical protein